MHVGHSARPGGPGARVHGRQGGGGWPRDHGKLATSWPGRRKLAGKGGTWSEPTAWHWGQRWSLRGQAGPCSSDPLPVADRLAACNVVHSARQLVTQSFHVLIQ